MVGLEEIGETAPDCYRLPSSRISSGSEGSVHLSKNQGLVRIVWRVSFVFPQRDAGAESGEGQTRRNAELTSEMSTPL